MIGTILSNRYRLIAELGSGGMAWVYLGEDLRENEYVAVKVLYPQHSQDLSFLQRFSQEAKLAMSLSQCHPERHIVCVLDYGSDQDIHYLVMEFVQGQDLHQILEEQGAMAWPAALRIARQVAEALKHASEYEVVHRDIKPGNIMILPDGTVRVLDFGIARARTSPHLTMAGFVGSPYYAAPEQAKGETVDSRADIYSLGIVIYRMLSGNLPFQADTPWAIVNQHIESPPPPLDEVCPDLPQPVIDLAEKALAKSPEDRFQTPGEMVEEIDAILTDAGLAIDPDPEELGLTTPALDEIYDRAQKAIAIGAWYKAANLFSQILKVDPDYRDVTKQLTEASVQIRLATLYRSARQAVQLGRWEEALDQLDELDSIAPDYKDAAGLRARAEARQELDGDEVDPDAGDSTQIYASDSEQIEALAAIRVGKQEPQPAEGSAKSKRRRWLVWAVVLALIVCLPLGIYGFYLSQQSPVANPTPDGATATATLLAKSTDTAEAPPTTSPTSKPATPSPEPSPTQRTQPTEIAVLDTPTVTPTLTVTPTVESTATRPPLLRGQIAFPRFSRVRGTYDVYICQVDGSDCRRVTTQASQPDLLPDGDQVVIHSWRPDDKGISLFDLDGQLVWQISRLIEAARPSVDFEGKIYAYHAREEADRQPRLYRTYSAENRPIRREGSPVLGKSPSWTPDGRILYSGCLGDACGIILMDANGARPRQIVAGSNEINAEASPNGKQVAFMSLRDGNWEVYVADIDGGNLSRLTRNPANDGLPTWSPDGRHIAFVSNRDGEWAVWAMRPDGSDQRLLFAIGGPLDGQVQNAAPHESHGWLEERISWSPLP